METCGVIEAISPPNNFIKFLKMKDYNKRIKATKNSLDKLRSLPLHEKEYCNKRREYFTLEARYEEMVYANDLISDLEKEVEIIRANYSKLLSLWEDCVLEINNRNPK